MKIVTTKIGERHFHVVGSRPVCVWPFEGKVMVQEAADAECDRPRPGSIAFCFKTVKRALARARRIAAVEVA